MIINATAGLHVMVAAAERLSGCLCFLSSFPGSYHQVHAVHGACRVQQQDHHWAASSPCCAGCHTDGCHINILIVVMLPALLLV
jgi:hypothetical protein